MTRYQSVLGSTILLLSFLERRSRAIHRLLTSAILSYTYWIVQNQLFSNDYVHLKVYSQALYLYGLFLTYAYTPILKLFARNRNEPMLPTSFIISKVHFTIHHIIEKLSILCKLHHNKNGFR